MTAQSKPSATPQRGPLLPSAKSRERPTAAQCRAACAVEPSPTESKTVLGGIRGCGLRLLPLQAARPARQVCPPDAGAAAWRGLTSGRWGSYRFLRNHRLTERTGPIQHRRSTAETVTKTRHPEWVRTNEPSREQNPGRSPPRRILIYGGLFTSNSGARPIAALITRRKR
jgi:hypothetical protein